MVAPLPGDRGGGDLLALVLAMDPARSVRERGREGQLPGRRAEGRARAVPARGSARRWLTDEGMAASTRAATAARYAWDLRWEPAPARLRPRPSAAARGEDREDDPLPSASRRRGERHGRRSAAARIEIAGARGGQAHLWGSKHATPLGLGALQRLHGADGSAADAFVDGVSVFVPRFGRELGPNTPVVARVGGTRPALDRPARGPAQPERLRARGLALRGAGAAAASCAGR